MSTKVEYVQQFRSKPESHWYDVMGRTYDEPSYLRYVYTITSQVLGCLYLWKSQRSDSRLVRRVIEEEVILTTEDYHE